MPNSVFERIEVLLQDQSVNYDVLRHRPVYTSAEAAEVRGTSLSSGAKALVCKADGEYFMIVMPANLRLDSKGVRRETGCRSLRFADASEVLEITGLTPGSIPPFGKLFSLETWCDEQLIKETTINFNAGDHEISVSMRSTDYLRVEQPRLGRFAK